MRERRGWGAGRLTTVVLLLSLVACGEVDTTTHGDADAESDAVDAAVSSDAAPTSGDSGRLDASMDLGDAALVPPDNAERAFGAHTWVRYQAHWVFDDASRDADGDVHFTSAEGLTVSLDTLMVTQGAMSMVPCTTQASLVDQGIDALSWMLGVPRIARANHAFDADSTFVTQTRVWNGLDESTQGYAEAPVLEAVTYCGFYHRFDPADGSAEPGIAYQSLWARGSYAAPGQAKVPFDVKVNLPQGAQSAFVITDRLSSFTGGTDVHVIFHAAGMFDGVSPSALSDRELAYALLRNLAQAVSVQVDAPAE